MILFDEHLLSITVGVSILENTTTPPHSQPQWPLLLKNEPTTPTDCINNLIPQSQT